MGLEDPCDFPCFLPATRADRPAKSRKFRATTISTKDIPSTCINALCGPRSLEPQSVMANLRSGRLLTCFYCGKRSSTRYDGLIREFLCLKCDATNYLDEVSKPIHGALRVAIPSNSNPARRHHRSSSSQDHFSACCDDVRDTTVSVPRLQHPITEHLLPDMSQESAPVHQLPGTIPARRSRPPRLCRTREEYVQVPSTT